MVLSFSLTCFGITSILSILYYLLKRKFDYWKIRSVPHLKTAHLFGNYKDYILLKKYSGFIAQDICREFPNEPYIGTYYGTEPALIVQDPELIKLILTKEFSFFSGREITKYCHREPITKNMFFNGGDEWKILRQNLTPLFSSAKMKNMFHLIQNCRDVFEETLKKETSVLSEVEVKSLATRYTMDCIGSCAFGINTESLTNNVSSNIFSAIGAEIYNVSPLRALKIIVRAIWPSIFYAFRFQLFTPGVQKFFSHTLSEVFQSRQFKETTRNDFVDVLLSWKNKSLISGTALSTNTKNKETVNIEVSNELMEALCVLFFAAGFETSSMTMSLTLYELAKNKNAQGKLIAEVDKYLKRTSGKVEYRCIDDLPFLEACISETMRLYPILGILTRETMEDYTLPSGLRLEKGLRIHIPLYHLHHNPEYFPNPEKYIPERFYGDEKQNVIPYTFLPFGEGPRICIGTRYARMQIYPALLTIFKDYEIETMPNTPKKLDYEPVGIVTHVKNEIHLKFIERNKHEVKEYLK